MGFPKEKGEKWRPERRRLGMNCIDPEHVSATMRPLKTHWLLLGLIAALASGTLTGQELPEKDPSGNGLDFEPQILLIEPVGTTEAGEGAPTDATVESARKRAERAAATAARWQKLARSGVLSKVEGEEAALRAVKANARYQELRLKVSREKQSPELAKIEEEELAARQQLHQAELQFARNMVDRLRKLRALRIGSASQLKRAETALQLLEAKDK